MVQIKQKSKMTPEQFCYWLQGYFELSSEERPQLYAEQTRIVRDHLALVFEKVTPKLGMVMTTSETWDSTAIPPSNEPNICGVAVSPKSRTEYYC